MNENHITDNKEAQRFEMPAGKGLAFIAYEWHHDRLALMHTEVPSEAEGKGIAGTLAKYVLEKAKRKILKLMCSALMFLLTLRDIRNIKS